MTDQTRPMDAESGMDFKDFVKWLEVKANKYAASGAWHGCIVNLIDEFEREWANGR